MKLSFILILILLFTACKNESVGLLQESSIPYDMEEPNFFGLSIAYDPYMREVVQADRLLSLIHI